MNEFEKILSNIKALDHDNQLYPKFEKKYKQSNKDLNKLNEIHGEFKLLEYLIDELKLDIKKIECDKIIKENEDKDVDFYFTKDKNFAIEVTVSRLKEKQLEYLSKGKAFKAENHFKIYHSVKEKIKKFPENKNDLVKIICLWDYQNNISSVNLQTACFGKISTDINRNELYVSQKINKNINALFFSEVTKHIDSIIFNSNEKKFGLINPNSDKKKYIENSLKGIMFTNELTVYKFQN